jgi:hypothetical protein
MWGVNKHTMSSSLWHYEGSTTGSHKHKEMHLKCHNFETVVNPTTYLINVLSLAKGLWITLCSVCVCVCVCACARVCARASVCVCVCLSVCVCVCVCLCLCLCPGRKCQDIIIWFLWQFQVKNVVSTSVWFVTVTEICRPQHLDKKIIKGDLRWLFIDNCGKYQIQAH